ncbi:MAG: cell division protein SepF [Clostridia bacterium]|nr:cell division protein SepF [Clostridia bacterium]
MKDLFNKFKNIIGVSYDDEEDEEEQELVVREPQRKSIDRTKSNVSVISETRKGKIVGIQATTEFKVVVLNIHKFEEVLDIADHLKAKKPVVINMESVDAGCARRVIDFLSGVVYAIEGGIQKVSKGIMLVTPYTVEIMGDFEDELRSKGLFPWED